MNCPRCGAGNRDGASYCDSCGEPLVAGAERQPTGTEGTTDQGTLLESGGVTSWMAFDWLARFAIVGVIGFLVGIWTLAQGLYEYSGLFFLLCAVGIGGTWFMLKAK